MSPLINAAVRVAERTTAAIICEIGRDFEIYRRTATRAADGSEVRRYAKVADVRLLVHPVTVHQAQKLWGREETGLAQAWAIRPVDLRGDDLLVEVVADNTVTAEHFLVVEPERTSVGQVAELGLKLTTETP